MAELPSCRITVLGSGGVGKSCLTTRLVSNQYITEYLPTIEDLYRHNIEVDGQSVMLSVLDTAGQDDYVTLRPQWMKHGEAFLLVYACDSRSSFAELQTFYHSIIQHRREEAEDELYSDSEEEQSPPPQPRRQGSQSEHRSQQQAPDAAEAVPPGLIPPIVMVCNKVDLPAESRVISRSEGERLAAQLGIGYIETSAQEGINCTEAFAMVVRKALLLLNSQKDKRSSRPSRFWCCIL